MPFIIKSKATKATILAEADRQIAILEARIQSQEKLLQVRANQAKSDRDIVRHLDAQLAAHRAEARVTPQAIANTLQDAYREAQAAIRDAQAAYLTLVRFGSRQIDELRKPILVTK